MAKRPGRKKPRRPAGLVRELSAREVKSLRSELSRRPQAAPNRWNADPEEAQRSLARLVLTLVEFLRRLMERQAIRRMEGSTLSDNEAEDIGLALLQLERTIRQLARQFGLDPAELNLDLGPLGKLH